ncbi:MAG: quinolinate synthase NadA [Deltaproteobacteria bacterium]|nr:quinolinate synthase NadA [Deltaproteobacteria bacterium]
MQPKLQKLMPDFEIRAKAELAFEITKLKKARGAVILGHNYMEAALYNSVPDFVGDSLELSRKAAKTESNPIVFCGVRFMAETAKILNPDKTVLLPAAKAGCSLASSITAADVRKLRAEYPGIPIVTYINTYADVKAEVDICCTSANASKVVESLKSDTVIFLPDEYLARNVAAETGKQVFFPESLKKSALTTIGKSQQNMIAWHGRCEVHEKFSVEDITAIRKQFPDVCVLTHPECSPEVVAASDFSASTSRMVEFVKTSNAPHFLILTECSMADNIIAENPHKDILRLCSIRCPHMNEITLQDTLDCLKYDRYVVDVPKEIRDRARRSLERMLEVH